MGIPSSVEAVGAAASYFADAAAPGRILADN